ncbi:hypothetical protein ACKI1I_13210 [Streptomyces turgidiscabies]|uniref:Cupin domain protein n=1 Tax=Streptomyces turgidiscabies (strain Car8) TaxID=698760 RepID=L7EVZ7_STRT8|nr:MULTISPECIES: hypothetical protein [Streptomyces]ELP62560.1 hypothetical protein STRTUCAR8_00983 [Streptomyces turgidiscabies Car8]MDX3494858.1 hypothetical protein [Streptomyces turgidiscabies]GAQ71472.1 hypothetical protein T45_03214 [Streptomyces turgidiscabies]
MTCATSGGSIGSPPAACRHSPGTATARVFACAISGKWGYLERPWTATAGDFVYEAPGEGHALVAYDSAEPMKAFFIVKGPLIWLDENGEPDGFFDMHDHIKMCRERYEKAGIGAGCVNSLFR